MVCSTYKLLLKDCLRPWCIAWLGYPGWVQWFTVTTGSVTPLNHKNVVPSGVDDGVHPWQHGRGTEDIPQNTTFVFAVDGVGAVLRPIHLAFSDIVPIIESERTGVDDLNGQVYPLY